MAKRKYNEEREMELARGYRDLTLSRSDGRLGYATKDDQDLNAFLGIFYPEMSDERKEKIRRAIRKE